MHRRQYLAGTGLALSATVGGCLDSTTSLDEEDPRGTETRSPSPTTEPEEDPARSNELSIDSRLHNERDVAHTFTVAILDSDGNTVREFEQTVGPNGSFPVSEVGKPNTSRRFEVTVDGTTAAETFTFDVEPTPRKLDGVVEITYTGSGDIEMVFTSLEDAYSSREVIEADPRVDTPPYDIEEPAPPNDQSSDEWNDDYLGENQPTSPSLAFERIDVPSGVVFQHAFREYTGSAYWVEAITDAVARDLLLNLEHADEQTRARLTGIDFEERVLVAVQTGYGSGSVSHRWSRVEATDDGLHLHGYYTDPYIQTDDLTSWVTILDVERPADGVLPARVSLTIDTDRRVHFNSTEGVVTLDQQ